jgi:hypothetical protein
MDSAALTPISKAELAYDPPREVTAQGLTNLEAFARLFGYVRFFHPSDEAAKASWDKVALAGVQRVESANDTKALVATLKDVFAPIAPSVQLYPTGATAPAPVIAARPPEGGVLIHWVHRGAALDSSSAYTYTATREPATDDATPEIIQADLGGGVSASVPISLYNFNLGTEPAASAAPITLDKPADFRASGDDRTTRLADVVLAWTALQHFFPLFDLSKADWPAELRTALRSAAIDTDGNQFEETLERMIAPLNDDHINLRRRPSRYLPVAWRFVEGRLVVTGVRPGLAGGLQVGDVVTAIDGQPIKDLEARLAPRISAATRQ